MKERNRFALAQIATPLICSTLSLLFDLVFDMEYESGRDASLSDSALASSFRHLTCARPTLGEAR